MSLLEANEKITEITENNLFCYFLQFSQIETCRKKRRDCRTGTEVWQRPLSPETVRITVREPVQITVIYN